MDKHILKMLIKKERVPREQFSKFIVDFLTFKNKSCSGEQLQYLLIAIERQMIDIFSAMEELAIDHFKWSIVRIYGKDGNLIVTNIYENG